RDGKVALDDFRGNAVLVGLFRGLHCPFCRRHIAAMAQLDGALRERGVESLTVVNTPIERARLYFRHHPLPNLLAASDPQRASHRAFGLPALEFTENETAWPHKVSYADARSIQVELPNELPEPMDPFTALEILNRKDRYDITEDDERMMATGLGQMLGQFLIDREGVVRWTFTDMFGAPTPTEVMSAATQVA
ncbi:MAG: redoxin domain-containing protein, partial [Hyphomicrobiales bacterium]|nr:redoxin domain-containing protein [Hyphomicrobiales bacterium]